MSPKYTLFGTLCALLWSAVSSGQVVPEIAALPGVPGVDRATAIAVDAADNAYITGYSYRGTGYDYVTIKYAPDGRALWARRYDGPGGEDDRATAIALDGKGDAYVTGSSQGKGTGRDYATLKYDPDGRLLWERRDSGPGVGYDYPTALAVDRAGNATVTGYSQGEDTGHDYLTIRYDPNGKKLWERRYNGAGNGDDRAVAVGLDREGNAYITGSAQTAVNNVDYLTLKYDPAGKELWARSYNGRGRGTDTPASLAVDPAGNVVVTGSSYGGGTAGDDYLTVKYDTNGRQLWARRYNGAGNGDDRAVAVALDSQGGVYITGSSDGGAATGADYLTIKYDVNGRQLWEQRYNGEESGSDRAVALAVDAAGNAYVTGYSYSGTSSGRDYMTVKYDASGKPQWAKRYNGPGGDYDVPAAIALDGQGGVYVTGSSWAGPTARFDYATLKYDGAGTSLWVQRYDAASAEATGAQDAAKSGTAEAPDNKPPGVTGGTPTITDTAALTLPGWVECDPGSLKNLNRDRILGTPFLLKVTAPNQRLQYRLASDGYVRLGNDVNSYGDTYAGLHYLIASQEKVGFDVAGRFTVKIPTADPQVGGTKKFDYYGLFLGSRDFTKWGLHGDFNLGLSSLTRPAAGGTDQQCMLSGALTVPIRGGRWQYTNELVYLSPIAGQRDRATTMHGFAFANHRYEVYSAALQWQLHGDGPTFQILVAGSFFLTKLF